jgi:rhodanese-related sulfurtransferase
VGDAVEVRDYVTREQALIPLAGPANRQGRIAADNIAGRSSTFRGSQGTSVLGLLGMTLAGSGASEKTLKRIERPYKKVYIHSNNHAGYYPGAKTIDLKLMFDPEGGRILGCQAVGEGEGVDKVVDVMATLIQKEGTVYDLEEAELCYAPQYGSAKSVANIAGMVAANVLRGDHPLVHWDTVDWEAIRADDNALIVDVREPSEVERGSIKGAVNYPLSSLRDRVGELPQDKKLYVYCQVGLRGYNATRQLLLAGLDAVNVSGGYRSAAQCCL